MNATLLAVGNTIAHGRPVGLSLIRAVHSFRQLKRTPEARCGLMEPHGAVPPHPDGNVFAGPLRNVQAEDRHSTTKPDSHDHGASSAWSSGGHGHASPRGARGPRVVVAEGSLCAAVAAAIEASAATNSDIEWAESLAPPAHLLQDDTFQRAFYDPALTWPHNASVAANVDVGLVWPPGHSQLGNAFAGTPDARV